VKKALCTADRVQVFRSSCPSLRLFCLTLWPLINIDEAICWEALSVSSLCLAKCYVNQGRKHDYDRAFRHAEIFHTQALGSINKRLGCRIQGNSNGVIAAIVCFVCLRLSVSTEEGYCWESVASKGNPAIYSWDQWHMHMRGLRSILATRGGIASIEDFPALSSTLFL
jgi:hypothetical protein